MRPMTTTAAMAIRIHTQVAIGSSFVIEAGFYPLAVIQTGRGIDTLDPASRIAPPQKGDTRECSGPWGD
jgi:hypothetical protein